MQSTEGNLFLYTYLLTKMFSGLSLCSWAMFDCGKLCLAFSLLILSAGVAALPLERFYPFGASAANEEYLNGTDDVSAELRLAVGYIFFGKHYESIYVSKTFHSKIMLLIFVTSLKVNDNGHLSPGSAEAEHTPFEGRLQYMRPLIAVFWSDVGATDDYGGNISFRQTNDSALRQKAVTDIRRAYPDISSIDYLVIATWDHVRAHAGQAKVSE